MKKCKRSYVLGLTLFLLKNESTTIFLYPYRYKVLEALILDPNFSLTLLRFANSDIFQV